MPQCKRKQAWDVNAWLGNYANKVHTQLTALIEKAEYSEAYPKPELGDVFVFTITEDEKKCPLCDCLLIKADFEKRRCLACRVYLRHPGESLNDIIEIRAKSKYHSYDLAQSYEKPKWFVWPHFMINGGASILVAS